MPSGPPKLHRQWCDRGPYIGHGDANALHLLQQGGLKPNRGGMFLIPKSRVLTDDETSALDYLWMEWDYGSQPVEDGDAADR